MKLRHRFTLIGIFITIFVFLAPVLVFYARGFKYDFSTGQIVKTGTLVLRSEPNKASVFLNLNTESTETPANIRFLLPGNYDIRIEKELYQTWQKRLGVSPQFVTWGHLNREKIFLLLQEPKLLNSYLASNISKSSNNQELAYSNDGIEYFLRVDSGDIETLGQTSSLKLTLPSQAQIDWTDASQIWQLLQTTDKWPISNTEVQSVDSIHTNGRRTVILNEGVLSSFEISKMEVIADPASAALIEDNLLWYISEGALYLYDFNTKTSQVIASNLPKSSGKIIRGNDQVYVLSQGELYHVRDTVEKIYSPVTFADWSDDAQRLTYGNGNEVYLHDPVSNKSELALRSLSPITNPILNWTTGYIFYVNEGKIKAAELDTRNGQNQFNILDFSGSLSFVLSMDGQRLYLAKPDKIEEYRIR